LYYLKLLIVLLSNFLPQTSIYFSVGIYWKTVKLTLFHRKNVGKLGFLFLLKNNNFVAKIYYFFFLNFWIIYLFFITRTIQHFNCYKKIIIAHNDKEINVFIVRGFLIKISEYYCSNNVHPILTTRSHFKVVSSAY